MSPAQPLTREKLAQLYQWNQFPDEIQDLLFRHYQQFSHNGDLRQAQMDIQSASDTLSWVQQGERIDNLLHEHTHYFGELSAEDLVAMAKKLLALKS